MGSKGEPADRAEGPVTPAGLLGRGENPRMAEEKSESCWGQEKPEGGNCHCEPAIHRAPV